MSQLLLAILCSALIAIFMRLSNDRVKNNVSLLAVNYLVCLAIGCGYTGMDQLLPSSSGLGWAVGLGSLQGVLYMLNFVLLQMNVRRSGVVLSSIFVKLGLLVSLAASIFFFRDRPNGLQIAGFAIAIGAIVLINWQRGNSGKRYGLGLVVMLFMGGLCDTMSKVYEQYGAPELSAQFLLYTFLVAALMCLALMLVKKQRIGKNELLYGVLIGVPNYFSAKFLLGALEEVSAMIVYPTFSVGAILVVTLAGVVLFKERLARRQWMAVAAILAALVMLNIPS